MVDTTLTASGSGGSEASAAPVAQLFVCLQGGGFEHPPTRHILHGLHQATIARGEGSTERLFAGGRHVLRRFLEDRKVSSQHLVLSRVGDDWVAEDVGSKNGTRLNGTPLKRARLADGDVLELGNSVLLFRDQVPVEVRNTLDSQAFSLGDGVLDWVSFHDPLVGTYRRLADVAPRPLPVGVRGETGTGKEVVARGLHTLSGLSGELVAVNCAAVAGGLVEAEFFGHVRGAFTGSTGERQGWIRSAQRGTLFLDEIGDLPLAGQAALLRALESGEVTPVGSDRAVRVQFRLVTATHRDLDEAVAAGTFRADLRARLGTFTAHLPPLRERPEDILLLVPRLLERLGQAQLKLAPGAAARLLRHPWPGNIRELVHALGQAVALADDGIIEEKGLPIHEVPGLAPVRVPDDPEELGRRDELVALLTETRGNVAEVGRRLGKHRELLYRMFEKYGVDPAIYRR